MKKNVSILILFTSIILLTACSGSQPLPPTEEGEIPGWFFEFSNDMNFFTSAKTATSKDMQMAIDKAVAECRAEISNQLNLKVQNLIKKFSDEVGTNENSTLIQQYSNTIKTYTEQQLAGSRIMKQHVKRDGDNFRAYALVIYPLGAANAALQNALQKDKEMWIKYQASEAQKDLDEESRKYNEELEKINKLPN
ncbi:MAG: LPP20 family lipoprotein [Ignavibacteriales bacterium]|nr:LPP20 family lipoprotein [Ignavibacteriales bacterium]MCF8316756.1 LPP20 family lipoprotein [Ignavibacteriales bacterium]MCF8436010.1 LPP20 family lipoprotein [Ignavibacteriales bacterium]